MKFISKLTFIIGLIAILLFISPKVFATVWNGGFGSASTLTYGVQHGSISNANIAASQWNNKSSHVHFSNSQASSVYGLTANIILDLDYTAPPTSGQLGYTYTYKVWTGASAILASTNERRAKAVVYQYKNPIFNVFPASAKIETITHELGHTLSIAHAPVNGPDAVMQQGTKASYSLKPYDIQSLYSKWGY